MIPAVVSMYLELHFISQMSLVGFSFFQIFNFVRQMHKICTVNCSYLDLINMMNGSFKLFIIISVRFVGSFCLLSLVSFPWHSRSPGNQCAVFILFARWQFLSLSWFLNFYLYLSLFLYINLCINYYYLLLLVVVVVVVLTLSLVIRTICVT